MGFQTTVEFTTDLQTTVKFADRYLLNDLRNMKHFSNCLVRQVIDADPIRKIVSVSVFTDDGKGNGNFLYKFDLM